MWTKAKGRKTNPYFLLERQIIPMQVYLSSINQQPRDLAQSIFANSLAVHWDLSN